MRLTRRLLEAMQEALIFRLAGELGDEAQPVRDYDDAATWIAQKLNKLRSPVS